MSNPTQPKTNTDVLYFGYGANKHPQMIQAIIGRTPSGYPGTVTGFKLFIQSWKEIPPSVRKELQPPWDETFKTYCLKISNNQTSRVKGIVWQITRRERKLIDRWEITGKWYNVHTINFADSNGIPTQIEIQIMDHPAKQQVSGTRYKAFLNSKQKMLQNARAIRRNPRNNF